MFASLSEMQGVVFIGSGKISVGKLSQQIYESYPLRRVRLLRELLNVMKLTCNDRAASFTLTLETATKLGASFSSPRSSRGGSPFG